MPDTSGITQLETARLELGVTRLRALAGAPAPREVFVPERLAKSSATASLRVHSLVSVAVIVTLFGGFLVWSAVTEVAGAVATTGIIVVDGGSKKVQHQEGGIVRDILVQDDDPVSAGQLLVRLDGTAISASLEIVESQLRDASAQETRLLAESAEATDLRLSSNAVQTPVDGAMSDLLAQQDRLRDARASARQQQSNRLSEQISQLQEQMAGDQAQFDAGAKSLALAVTEDDSVSKLLAKALVNTNRANEVKRARAQLEGEQGRLAAAIAEAKAAIAEREVQIGQISADFQSQVLSDLQTLRQKIAELEQQKIAAQDKLQRLDIRAPTSGTIHESTVHTLGGVVQPGETLMLVVPKAHGLSVDARLGQADVTRVAPDQSVVLKFPSLDPRTTPDLHGTVVSISPDVTRDPTTGQTYYSMHVAAPDEELAKLGSGFRLIPGMPVEAFAQTGNRTVLSYLLQPVVEQLAHVFIER